MLSRDRVQQAVVAADAARLKKLEVTGERIIQAVGAQLFADPKYLFDEQGHLKPVAQMPATVRLAISSIEFEDGKVKRVRLADRGTAARLLMQHKGLLREIQEVQSDIRIRWAGQQPWEEREAARERAKAHIRAKEPTQEEPQ